MHNILVATDGSAAGDRAVDTAIEFAKALGAPLTIVNVQEERPLTFVQEQIGEVEYNDLLDRLQPPPAGELVSLYQRLGIPAAIAMTQAQSTAVNRELSERILGLAEDRARQGGISNVKTALTWGDPAHQILEQAKKTGADLIVIGRRGLGRFSELLLGSVSQKVLHHAPVKVLTVA